MLVYIILGVWLIILIFLALYLVKLYYTKFAVPCTGEEQNEYVDNRQFRLYELIYMHKHKSAWSFKKTPMLQKLVEDFNNDHINTMVIKETVYSIEKYDTMYENRIILTLVPICKTSKLFISCNEHADYAGLESLSDNTFAVLWVMCYNYQK